MGRVGTDERVDERLGAKGERGVDGCTRVMIWQPRRGRDVCVERRRRRWCRCHESRVSLTGHFVPTDVPFGCSVVLEMNFNGAGMLPTLAQLGSSLLLTHHGPRKACTLRDRCNPSVHRRSRRKALHRLRVRHPFAPCADHLISIVHSPDTETISNPTIRSLTEQYLGFGETVFNALQGTVVTSPYFKRSERQQ